MATITIEVKRFGKSNELVAKAFGDGGRGLLATAVGLHVESAAALCRANIKFPCPWSGDDIIVIGPDDKLYSLHKSFKQESK